MSTSLIAVMMIVIGAQRFQRNETVAVLLPAYGQSGSALNVYTKILARRSGIMNKQFRIAYKLEGVRVVDVWIPEDVSLPSDWERMSFDQQDEWLYSFQEKSVTQYEDIHYSRAESVMAVRRLKAVDNG